MEEGDGFEGDRDEYTAEKVFFVPESARWSAIAEAAHTPEIGLIIDKAMQSIEDENPKLKGVLPKNFARPELDARRLGDVVDLFTNIRMTDDESSKDILGGPTSTASPCSPSRNGRMRENSTRRLPLCGRSSWFFSRTKAGCTIRAAGPGGM